MALVLTGIQTKLAALTTAVENLAAAYKNESPGITQAEIDAVGTQIDNLTAQATSALTPPAPPAPPAA